MHKKLITACMALVAFAALAIGPATASATNDPTLVDSSGHLAVGAKIVGTAVNPVFTDTSGNTLVTCSNATMTGEVVKNSAGTVEGTISTLDFWGGGGAIAAHNGLEECPGSFGNFSFTVVGHLCIRSTPTMATDEFQVTSGTCPGTGNVKFIIGSTIVGECEYESTSSVKGDYTTGIGGAMAVRNTQAGSGTKKIRGGFFCSSSLMLKISFKLETHDGTAVEIL